MHLNNPDEAHGNCDENKLLTLKMVLNVRQPSLMYLIEQIYKTRV